MANILIIDDDIAVREYLATLVTRLNHTPFQAATCADGVVNPASSRVEALGALAVIGKD